ncbi:MAG: hypothetical protein LBG20_02110 [Holosporaceae bacterium]|nr:hypothetical protein [Holosporaceae bacterium]
MHFCQAKSRKNSRCETLSQETDGSIMDNGKNTQRFSFTKYFPPSNDEKNNRAYSATPLQDSDPKDPA